MCREELCVRDEPSSDTDLRLALVEPARQHTAHSPHTASVRRVARRRAACEKTHCSRLKSRACRLRPPSSHTHTHTHTTHMIGYASRPHQPLHEESASAKLFPAPWTRLFMCVHTPSRLGAEWRGAHVGSRAAQVERTGSGPSKRAGRCCCRFVFAQVYFIHQNKQKKAGAPYLRYKKLYCPWSMVHGAWTNAHTR